MVVRTYADERKQTADGQSKKLAEATRQHQSGNLYFDKRLAEEFEVLPTLQDLVLCADTELKQSDTDSGCWVGRVKKMVA